MKVLAFLQNQWFKDPERVRAILARHDPAFRRNFVKRALFAGCQTGRILKAGLGEEWCNRIVWEEASLEIGGTAASAFKADTRHILDAIVLEQPTVIIALGKIATDAIASLCPFNLREPATVFSAPHPAARNAEVLDRLRHIRAELDKLEEAKIA